MKETADWTQSSLTLEMLILVFIELFLCARNLLFLHGKGQFFLCDRNNWR